MRLPRHPVTTIPPPTTQTSSSSITILPQARNSLFSFTTSLQPSRRRIKPYIVAQLAETCDNIVGIKDSSGDWTNCLSLLARLGDKADFSIMLGSHTALGAAVLFGADGGVVSISNVAPKESVALYNAAKARDIDEVNRLQKLLLRLSKMYTYGQGVSGMKACLEILGVCNAHTTGPLLPIGETVKDELQQLLSEAGITE